MAKTVRDEQLILNVLVNGDEAKKRILDLEKSITSSRETLKSMRDEQSKFVKGSEEWKRLKAEIDNVKGSIKSQQSELAKARMEQSRMNASVDDLRKRIRLLRDTLSKTNPNTEEWRIYNDELRLSRNRLAQLEAQSKAMHGTICGLAEAAQKYWGPILASWKLIQMFRGQIDEAKQSWLQYDEALVDAMKTTGLSRDEIEELSEELKKFDTRTAQNELLSLARVGGKLGLSGKEDLLEFVSAADKINVALKEDLGGDAEAAIGQIGKLVDIFQLKGQMGLERAMLSVGSAINELGAASTANEGYIVNFTNRLAGIAPNASISIDKILGLASTLDANAQAAETAATAIGQTITAMFKKTETFAQIAKMPFKEFRDLLTNDVNGALVKVLEGMKGDQGLFDIVDAMDEMHLNGQRATTVLGALANNVDMLKTQQQLANEAFQEGTSLTNEFNTKNESATAIQEKLKKRITETSVEIGQKLMPIANMTIGVSNSFLGIISKLITLLGKYGYAIGTATALTALYIVKKKIAYLFSADFRVALMKEVAALEAAGKANSLHTVSLKILAGGYKTAGAAAKAFGKALIANPVGLVIAGITALAQGISFLVSKSREATKELRELNKRTVDTTSSFVKAQAEIDKERKSLEELKDAATKAAEGSDERKRVIDKINELYGDYLPNLLTEKTSNEEIETALKNVNTQLEQKIKLQARENAEMDIQKHRTDAIKGAVDAIISSYKKITGQNMPAEAISSITTKVAKAYDTNDIKGLQKDIEESIGKELPTWDFYSLGNTKDWGLISLKSEFQTAIDKGNELRATVNGLFGDLSNGPSGNTAPLGSLIDGANGNAGTDPKNMELSAEERKRLEEEAKKERERQERERQREEKQQAKEEARKIEEQEKLKGRLIIESETDLTEKALKEEQRRYDEEKKTAEGNAELLELVERTHRNRIDKIQFDAFNREIKRLEEEHRLKRQQMENSQAAELLAFKGTEEEKAALKRKHTAELANFDVEYLQNLEAMLQKVADAKTLEGMSVSLDDADYNKIMQQLADIIKRKNAAVGTAQESSQESSDGPKKESHSLTEGTGNGSLFGVSQDDWETFFANLKEGKFGAEDLQTVVAGIGGAAQEAFSLASKFMDLTKKKEDAQLKDYKKNQDNRKKSLEKRLNAGLITESQYNAQVEQMDAEYDAYQEELALKQAKRDKALNLTQAIINTALSVTSTIAQLGATPWGIAAAAIAAAMGAAEIAIIASQPVTSGAEEGGYIGVKRRQDGKSFNARLNPDARGFVSSPTVIVGENGSEYVIPHEALENPTLLPIISTMETARRNGKLRSLNFNAVYPATAMPGRVSGGFIDDGNSRIVTTSSDGHEGTATDAALAKAIEKLTKKLDEPITARVSMLGKGGIKETEDKYNKLKRRGQLG